MNTSIRALLSRRETILVDVDDVVNASNLRIAAIRGAGVFVVAVTRGLVGAHAGCEVAVAIHGAFIVVDAAHTYA
jgi:hypothetical protein